MDNWQRISKYLDPLFFLIILYLFLYSNRKIPDSSNQATEQSDSKKNLEEGKPDVSREKWIVVTSINHPTTQINTLSKIPGWQLLVVGDRKTPKNWAHPGVILLSAEMQEKLGYKILQHLPLNSYTRKIVGYLYAIQHGAKYIYDTDDDNAPELSDFEKSFVLQDEMNGLVKIKGQNDSVANPYAHFGQPTVWPRGYPLDQVGDSYNNSYNACKMRTPIIQQGVVNGDPDVDAIFRLTRKKVETPLNIRFDTHAPAIVFPKGLLSPFNSQNTLFQYPAFWALLLPVGVTFRVTDIWRGYWAQPLLWKIGAYLGFFSSKTVQLRNAHLYLRDFGEEDQLYHEASSLVNLLSNWDCKSTDSFFECVILLSKDMAVNGFWSAKDVELMQAWISDLKQIGYKEPDMTSSENDPCLSNSSKSLVNFQGVSYNEKHNIIVSNNEDIEQKSLRGFCNFTLTKKDPLPSGNPEGGIRQKYVLKGSVFTPNQAIVSPLFPNTLLIAAFSSVKSTFLMDILFRPHFPNILLCGGLDSTITENTRSLPFSVVYGNITGEKFSYECVLRAIEMGYSDLDGYLFIADNTLPNFWNFGTYDKESIWIGQKKEQSKEDNTANLAQLKDIYAKMDATWVKEFQERLSGNNNATLPAEMASFSSKIFYITSSKADMFNNLGKLFRSHEVGSDFAVGAMTIGLSPKEKLVSIPILEITDKDNPFQENYSGNFNESSQQAYAANYTKIIENDEEEQFCKLYVNSVLKVL